MDSIIISHRILTDFFLGWWLYTVWFSHSRKQKSENKHALYSFDIFQKLCLFTKLERLKNKFFQSSGLPLDPYFEKSHFKKSLKECTMYAEAFRYIYDRNRPAKWFLLQMLYKLSMEKFSSKIWYSWNFLVKSFEKSNFSNSYDRN